MTAINVPGAEVTQDRLIALRAHAGNAMATGESRSETGQRSGRRQGRGGDIFDLRPYQLGDDPRHIDAAASARSGRAQVRRRHDAADRTLLLIADFRAPMLWGTRGRLRSVAAAEELALAGWQAIAAGGRVGALVIRDGAAEALNPRPRDQAMLDVVGALVRGHAAAMETGTDGQTQPLGAALVRATTMLHPGASVLLATGLDLPGDDFAAAAEALMRKCRLEVLLVQDAVALSPPPGVFPVRRDGQTVRVRFGPSQLAYGLAGMGIPARVVDASAPGVLA